MFKSIGISLGAFFSNPLKFVVDPTNTVIEYQTKKSLAEGKTAAEVEEELKQVGMLKGAGPVKVIIDAVGTTLELVSKNLPLILLGFVVLIALYYFRGLKVVK
jgi:hypothetical protein